MTAPERVGARQRIALRALRDAGGHLAFTADAPAVSAALVAAAPDAAAVREVIERWNATDDSATTESAAAAVVTALGGVR